MTITKNNSSLYRASPIIVSMFQHLAPMIGTLIMAQKVEGERNYLRMYKLESFDKEWRRSVLFDMRNVRLYCLESLFIFFLRFFYYILHYSYWQSWVNEDFLYEVYSHERLSLN